MEKFFAGMIALGMVWGFWEVLMWRHRVAMKRMEEDNSPKVGKRIKITKTVEETLDDWEKKIS